MPSRRRRARAISDLRLAIDCLPERTREAMLEGIRANDIIVGAYVDGDGGVCPMLAAHRCGGRTDLLAFARAWDRFTEVREVRPATRREIGILVAHLQDSLLGYAPAAFGSAIADHDRLVAARGQRPGDPERSRELKHRTGWAWLRPFRRLDEYQRALAELGDVGAEHAASARASSSARRTARERELV